MSKKVNKSNYKNYRYLKDYRNGALKKLTDEELEAQKYYIREIYRGVKYPLAAIKKLALQSIFLEQQRRLIERGKKAIKGEN